MSEDDQELSEPKTEILDAGGLELWKGIELIGEVSDADQKLSEFNYILEDWTGIELEETIGGERISDPFNPALIRVDTRPMSIDLLLKRIEHNELDLQPSFQRKDGIRSEGAKSRLIESLLVRIPLPAFYVDATDDDKWLVVDGLQRLTALKSFILDNTLKLRELEFLSHLDGKTYADLARPLQRRITETLVTIYVIEKGSPPELKFTVFKRINTGGFPLSAQEIRHALNQGPASEILAELASSADFKKQLITVFAITVWLTASVSCVSSHLPLCPIYFTDPRTLIVS